MVAGCCVTCRNLMRKPSNTPFESPRSGFNNLPADWVRHLRGTFLQADLLADFEHASSHAMAGVSRELSSDHGRGPVHPTRPYHSAGVRSGIRPRQSPAGGRGPVQLGRPANSVGCSMCNAVLMAAESSHVTVRLHTAWRGKWRGAFLPRPIRTWRASASSVRSLLAPRGRDQVAAAYPGAAGVALAR